MGSEDYARSILYFPGASRSGNPEGFNPKRALQQAVCLFLTIIPKDLFPLRTSGINYPNYLATRSRTIENVV